ncbi:Translation machinery-associated protein 22 [Coemansia javaensis]|uniref:Translation machinery-associated protein 22 n=1 Tax=Coemansia javaensis TaxID=2761396 RepID=A0A9W8HBJ1_9FUNG|nr:Translation machinery-associated protein 22 [Coemansia javaensis]
MAEPAAGKVVMYCGICGLPTEYCEFSASRKKCEEWLRATHPAEHERLYGDQAIAEKLTMTTLSEDKEAREAAKMEKAEQKSEARMARDLEKKLAARVAIKRIERNKRKCVTAVFGLHVFGIDLKTTAKMMANHFACGGSVAKNPQGLDEIVVQGDFSEEIRDLICAKFPAVPKDNIDLVEEKAKKKAAPQ